MAKLLTKEQKRAVASKLLPPIIYLFIKLIHFSTKKRFHIPKELPDEPFIVSFWHGKLLLAPYIYKEMKKDGKIGVMISDHFDGEIIARVMDYFNFDTIRGSSTRGGVKALKESFKLIEQGYDIAITPDGPKGPYQSVADGIVAIAQKKGLKIVAFNYSASSYWEAKSWDKFMIPKPFSTIDFYASDFFSVEGLVMDDAKRVIKEKLNENV